MVLYAFENGKTILDEGGMNSLLSLQEFQLIYEGTVVDSVIGSGVVENSLASYFYKISFTLTGATEISRIEMELDKDGEGADLVVQIRDNSENVLKEVVIPKEFIPAAKAYCSVPIGLTGLTAGATYWIMVLKSGDSTNKIDWVGETVAVSGHTCFRSSSGDTWNSATAVHFKVFSGESGELVHSMYSGGGYTIVQYSGEVVSKVYRYLPPADGPDGGIRDVITYQWVGEYLKGGMIE